MRANEMYETHPSFTLNVHPDTKIWRYMDFTKFLIMLRSDSLYFARADLLGDPFEAAYTRPMEKEYSAVLAYSTQEMSRLCTTQEEILEFMINQVKVFGGAFAKEAIKSFYVNCWHINENESAAMWKLYMKSDEGVAVQSTIGRLIESAKQSAERIFIGEIQYIDYNNDSFSRGNDFNAIVRKRQSFAHERELRAVITRFGDMQAVNYEYITKGMGSTILKTPDFSAAYKDHLLGIEACNNMKQLIENVYVYPSSPAWFGDLVSATAQDYSLTCKIERSTLEERPLW